MIKITKTKMSKHTETRRHFLKKIGYLSTTLTAGSLAGFVDGISLVPLLKGKKSLDRKAIYWHYPHYGNQGGFPGGVIRMADYKVIENYEDNSLELYNLKKDIGEKNNLAEKMPQTVDKLKTMLHNWRKEVDAKMPTKNPNLGGGS